ncbi:hypothetical protein ANCCAN_14219 [Ancylostoma caninum]|uniref:SCP domain-containing protein n=1 Tax=Ancylostoma caninum TaxID=29170 RepID=A0A368G608_ANCCA|nr:hypothetical protein ANCCAN_14219 [Ancylostoma caninum]
MSCAGKLPKVYDCHMEDIARRSSKFGKIKEIGSKGFGKIKEFGVNLSKRDLPKDGMLLNVIEEVLFSWSVSGGLRQMIHFYTTRIGCYYSIAAAKWSVEVICLYESKFKTDEILFEKGTACSHSNNCTLFSPSKCYDGLCAIVPQEQFYRNS